MEKFSSHTLELIILFLSFIFFLLFANKGLAVHDEGYILNAAFNFVQGKIPYKDFWIIYPPGIILTIGLLFKIFGLSILAGRYLMVLLGVVIASLLVKISQKLSPFPYSLLPAVLFIVWGIPHINYPWPTWFCFLFSLLSLYLLLNSKTNRAYLILAGISSGLCFSFKQTLGLASISSIILAAILIKPKHKLENLALTILGISFPLAALAIYLYLNQALSEAINIIFTRTFEYQNQGLMKASLPRPNLLGFANLGKTFFYYLPPTLFILEGIRLFIHYQVKLKQELICFIYLASFYLSGIYPTADLLHNSLVFIAPFIFIPTVFKQSKIWLMSLSLAIIFLGGYKLIYKNYAGFEAPYPKQNIKIVINQETIYTDNKSQKLIKTASYIQKLTQPQDKIFVYYYGPMVYFLSARLNATRFPMVQAGVLNQQQEQEAMASIKNAHLVVLQTPLEYKDKTAEELGIDNPKLLYNTLISDFSFIKQIGDFQIRLKK